MDNAEQFGEIADDSPLLGPFDLGVAPLMRGALLVSADGETELVLVAHHLIVDVVSWSHLIDDLGHLSQAVDGNGSAVLPAVTTSVRDWTERLVASASDLDTEPWEMIAGAESTPWPVAGNGTGELTGRHRIDPATTSRLVAHASDAGLGIDEVLISTLVSALSSSLGTDQVRLFLEGHGRDSDSAAVDVTRTMGWFTSLYPVIAEAPKSSDPTAVATAVRDQLSAALRSGRDYGVLRYLHPNGDVRARVALDHRAHLVFNYLGRVAHAGAAEGELVLAGAVQLTRSPNTDGIFGAEVVAYIDREALIIDWVTHSGAAEQLESIVEHVVDRLQSFLAKPTDSVQSFSLAGLDEAEMSKLASILGSNDGISPR